MTLGVITAVAVATGLIALTWGLLGSVVIPNTGTVKTIGVGVYWDSGCTSEVTSIDWGTIDVGATETVAVYIRNEGTDSMTLTLETENWSPSGASSDMSLTWDYGGQAIAVDGVVQVTLSLEVSDTIEGITSFSFDIVITGSG